MMSFSYEREIFFSAIFSDADNKHVLFLSWNWNERTDKSDDDDDEKQFK